MKAFSKVSYTWGILLFTFFYALLAFYLIREFVLPHYIVTTEGHIHGDPYFFHKLALDQVEKIKNIGFSEFLLRPRGQGPAGITSLIYLVSKGSWGVISLNAALHALATVFLYKILRIWFPATIALISILPFLGSPYFIHWLSQINKDSYSITGAMMFLYGFIQLLKINDHLNFYSIIKYLLYVAIGTLLIWLVRPYMNQILLPLVILILICSFMYQFGGGLLPTLNKRRDKKQKCIWAMALCIVAVILLIFNKGATSDRTLERLANLENVSKKFDPKSKSLKHKCLKNVYSNSWVDISWLPDNINNKVRAIIAQRCLIYSILETHPHHATQYSILDQTFSPNGTIDVLQYLPKAFLIGVFKPWPSEWFMQFKNKISIFYIFSSLEIILFLCTLPFLIFWSLKNISNSILIPLLVSSYVITVYATAIPYLGALYRYRYPWWMVLLSFALAATLTVLHALYQKHKTT